VKVSRIIVVSNVLVCFLLNNLLFTYDAHSQTNEPTEVKCLSDDNCCSEEQEACCEKKDCCANVPVSTSHLHFSLIAGIDKKAESQLSTISLNTFYLNKIKVADNLSDGYLTSLIKPPTTV
jgi:hypothetical protein